MDSLNKFEFSFVAPIHFLQKKWGEGDKISGMRASAPIWASEATLAKLAQIGELARRL